MPEASTESTPGYLRALLEDAPRPEPAAEDEVPSGGRGGPYVEPKLNEVEREFPDHLMDQEAAKIVRRLSEAGHTAFLVGGCVRDLLFGLRPKDFDIATSAEPGQIKKLFRNCRIIGRRFRLAHIFFRNKTIEVATFRAGNPAGDEENGELLIREDNVFGRPDEDAARRDFTINALFYDVDRSVILDYVGGVDDAENRLIRCIGDPRLRLREDPIRMLRAVRLAARLGGNLEPGVAEATQQYADEVLRAATPRILEDLLRMFRGGAIAPAFDLMLSLGVLEVLLPELHAYLRDHARDGNTDELEALRAALRTADRWTQQGRDVAPCVQLALLLAPVLMRSIADTNVRDAGAQINEALKPIAQRLSISRRDQERIRQVLIAQGRLAPRKKRRRRFSMSAFVRRAYFLDALDLFELMAETTGDLQGEVAKWRKRYAEHFPDGPPDEQKQKKSASRGHRRNREHGEKGARTG
jgi:poly(A) polymerase